MTFKVDYHTKVIMKIPFEWYITYRCLYRTQKHREKQCISQSDLRDINTIRTYCEQLARQNDGQPRIIHHLQKTSHGMKLVADAQNKNKRYITVIYETK